jgi:hypothetical protein
MKIIEDLQAKLVKTNNDLAMALANQEKHTTTSEGENSSRSVIGDPEKFNRTKPKEFDVWNMAVIGKIAGDGNYYFRNNDTIWEWLCGRVKGKVPIHTRQHRWQEFYSPDDLVMGNTEDYRKNHIIMGFIKTVYKHFGNPTEKLSINDKCQRCFQRNRTFQQYIQELSLLRSQMGSSTESEEFKGILEFRTADYLMMLVVNKKYATVEEAVADLQEVDARYSLLKGNNATRGERVENSDEIKVLKNELATMKQAQSSQQQDQSKEAISTSKKSKRQARTPGSIKEPCASGDSCRYKDSGTCWRQH